MLISFKGIGWPKQRRSFIHTLPLLARPMQRARAVIYICTHRPSCPLSHHECPCTHAPLHTCATNILSVSTIPRPSHAPSNYMCVVILDPPPFVFVSVIILLPTISKLIVFKKGIHLTLTNPNQKPLHSPYKIFSRPTNNLYTRSPGWYTADKWHTTAIGQQSTVSGH